MVALALVAALVAAVVAEARAGPVAAEDLPVTPLAIPLDTPLVVPAPAPRSTLTEVMVCPEPQEEIFKSQQIPYTPHGSSHTLSSRVFPIPPIFVAVFFF